MMWVKVTQLMEDGGRPMARHRAVTQRPLVVGQLSLIDRHDKELRRSVVCASLLSNLGQDMLPPLRDAVVRFIRDGAMTISGMETDDMTRKITAQSWYVEVFASDDVDQCP
jgi:hypothetical protein